MPLTLYLKEVTDHKKKGYKNKFYTEHLAYTQWRKERCNYVPDEVHLTDRTQGLVVIGASPFNWNAMRKPCYSVLPLLTWSHIFCCPTNTTERGIWFSVGVLLFVISSVVHYNNYKASISIKVGSLKNAHHVKLLPKGIQ